MVIINQATEKDIPMIEEIMTDVVDFLDSINQPQWGRENVTWQGLSRHFKIDDFYIAYMNNFPVACVAIIDYDPMFWADIKKGESLFLHKLAVKRCVAGKGVSTVLLDFAKAECKRRNIQTLRLDTHALRPKLRNFYERHGFDLVEERILFEKYHTAFYIWDRSDNK